MASGAGQSAVVTLLLDHGADLHAGTRVGGCSTALGVCMHISFVAIFISEHFNLIRKSLGT